MGRDATGDSGGFDPGLHDEDALRAEDDRAGNDLPLLSAYCTRLGEKLWIVTESDGSVTTIMLPEEY
jgi:hypothetical protein